MRLASRWIPLAFVSLLLACAHTRAGGDAEGARKTADLFHHRARWKDFGGAALLLAPELREPFEAARRAMRDERDLSIADYELEKIQLEPGAKAARVASRVSWYRLPSLTQRDDAVTTELEWRDGAWLVVRQKGGPFAAELSNP